MEKKLKKWKFQLGEDGNMERRPQPGQFYKHFKDKLYQVIAVARHSETEEEMVVYQALYGDFGVYVRPLDLFVSEVDHEKYPEVTQKYRFELIKMNPQQKDSSETVSATTVSATTVKEEKKHNGTKELVNPYLMQFLEANSCGEKLSVLQDVRNKIDETALYSMAASMDFTLSEGNRDDKIDSLLFYLQTMKRYEINRFR